MTHQAILFVFFSFFFFFSSPSSFWNSLWSRDLRKLLNIYARSRDARHRWDGFLCMGFGLPRFRLLGPIRGAVYPRKRRWPCIEEAAVGTNIVNESLRSQIWQVYKASSIFLSYRHTAWELTHPDIWYDSERSRCCAIGENRSSSHKKNDNCFWVKTCRWFHSTGLANLEAKLPRRCKLV